MLVNIMHEGHVCRDEQLAHLSCMLLQRFAAVWDIRVEGHASTTFEIVPLGFTGHVSNLSHHIAWNTLTNCLSRTQVMYDKHWSFWITAIM